MTDNTAVTKQAETSRNDSALLPPVDVIEDAGGITLYADLPGVSKEGLGLQVEADTLTIEGEITLAVPEGMESSHAEVSLPRYRRCRVIGGCSRFPRNWTPKKSAPSSTRVCSSCASRKPHTPSRGRSRSELPER